VPAERLRRAALLFGVALVCLLAAPAAAHTALAASSPERGGTVPDTTGEVVLTFTGELQPGLSVVAVTGPDGADRASGPPQQQGAELVQPVRAPLPAGRHTLAYRVVAADGHPLTGSVEFSVTADPASTPPAPAGWDATTGGSAPSDEAVPSAEPVPSGGVASPGGAADGPSPATVTALAAGGLALAGVAGLTVLARRRRG